jgi:hypothetical protein
LGGFRIVTDLLSIRHVRLLILVTFEKVYSRVRSKNRMLRSMWLIPAITAGLAVSAPFAGFTPGNLIVSRSVYQGTAATVTVGQALPPNCPAGNKSCTTATTNGAYPGVFNNDLVDSSFGVTSPIFLDEITTGGSLVNTFAVDPTQVVTSFPSKSELALNLSTDKSVVTFMGYLGAGVNALDVSNSNTPGVNDPTNPAGNSYYRGVVQVDAAGNTQITASNAYSGNNGRAAILANNLYYTVGNSNNGTGTPAIVVAAAGVQFLTPTNLPVSSQNPATFEVGSFSIAQRPYNSAPIITWRTRPAKIIISGASPSSTTRFTSPKAAAAMA